MSAQPSARSPIAMVVCNCLAFQLTQCDHGTVALASPRTMTACEAR